MSEYQTLLSRIQAEGILIDALHPDGKLRRFPTQDKPKSQNGFVTVFPDMRGAFVGNWATNMETYVSGNGHKEIGPEDFAYFEKAKEDFRLEKEREHERAAKSSRLSYVSGRELKPSHFYLKKKQIDPIPPGLKVLDGKILIPMTDIDGNHTSLQRICAAGEKRFDKGGKVTGSFFTIGGGDTIAICEGLATGASIHKAAGHTVVVAFNAGNLEPVAIALRGKYPDRSIIICADNDESGVGLEKAQKAAQAIQARVTMPEQPKTDFNDLHVNVGLEAVREQLGKFIGDTVTVDIWDKPVDLLQCLDRQPPKEKQLFTGRMPLGRGVVLAGVGGSSKTTIAKQMGIGAAIGSLTWEWEVQHKGKVFMVLTEDTEEDVWRSFNHMVTSLYLTDEEKQTLARNMRIYPLAGKDTKLMVRNKEGQLVRSPLYHSLQKKIEGEGGVVFTVLDPALAITEGEELDQGEQRSLGKAVDDLAVNTGSTVLLIAHATKGSLSKDELGSHNSRGGGALTDAVRAEISLRTMTKDEAKAAGITDREERQRHVQMAVTKANNLPASAFVPIWLRRDDCGMLHGVELTFKEKEKPKEKEYLALTVLKDISATRLCSWSEWVAKCLEVDGLITARSEKGIESAMLRIRAALERDNQVVRAPGKKGCWVPTDMLEEEGDCPF
jgi:RecA-family ATPase